jgi:hypothetical protein
MSRSSLSYFPAAISRAVAEHFPHANRRSLRVKEMGLLSDVASEFRRTIRIRPASMFPAAF